jgi:hypothetical protein
MKRYFTHYWKNDTWEANSDTAGEIFYRTSGNMFHRRGVASGDSVYAVTVIRGRLLLLGRLTVGRICSYAQAQQLFGTDIWPAEEHIIAVSGTPKRFDFEVPQAITEQLLFAKAGAGSPLRFTEPGHLDQQTLRGVRELEEASARLLDELLPTDTLISDATKDA